MIHIEHLHKSYGSGAEAQHVPHDINLSIDSVRSSAFWLFPALENPRYAASNLLNARLPATC